MVSDEKTDTCSAVGLPCDPYMGTRVIADEGGKTTMQWQVAAAATAAAVTGAVLPPHQVRSAVAETYHDDIMSDNRLLCP